MDHRLAEILGAGLPSLVPRDNFATRAVVIQHVRVIDREVVEPAIAVAHGISTIAHHITEEAIGVDDGAPRVVYKSRLHAPPCDLETLGVLARQRPDRKRFDSGPPVQDAEQPPTESALH